GATSFAYEWLRGAAPLAAGATYRPRASDAGHLISCQVTASNAAGSARAVSTAVRVRGPSPRLSALRITPVAFRAARSGPSDRRKGGRGGTVTFRLDERASVTFSVQRALGGREVNGRCRPDSFDHKARSCTVWRAVAGSFGV